MEQRAISTADRLLLMPDVAGQVRRPIGTLRDWRLKGIGPKSVKIGGRVYYRQSDVDAWIAEQFADADNPPAA